MKYRLMPDKRIAFGNKMKYTALCLHHFPLWKLSGTAHGHIHKQFTITSIEAVIDRIIRLAEWINSITAACVRCIHLLRAGRSGLPPGPASERAVCVCVFTVSEQHSSKHLQDPIKPQGIFGVVARWRIKLYSSNRKWHLSPLCFVRVCVRACADSVK